MREKASRNGSPYVLLGLLLLPAILIGAISLSNIPSVSASPTCTYAGGAGGGQYYYATTFDKDDNYSTGVGANLTTAAWKFVTTSTESHQLFYVNLSFDSTDWAQAGYVNGTLDSTTFTALTIYFEFGVSGTGNLYTVSGHTIPIGDKGYSEVWQSSVNGNGDYIDTAKVYSPYWSESYSVDYNVGTKVDGVSLVSTEVDYLPPYSGSCDQYSADSVAHNLVYKDSIGSAEPKTGGLSWTSCYPLENSPYSISTSTCSGTNDFYGGY
jgi:hypothetical protein